MQQVSTPLQIAFIIVTLLTVFEFYRATNGSKTFLTIISIWMLIQLLIGLTDFYTDYSTKPPRFFLLLSLPTALIIIMFLTNKGRIFMDSLNLKQLTLLHSIRIVVEIILYYLFVAKTIPEEMTFSGRNFDIIAGLTAPVMFYFAFNNGKVSRKFLLAWNIISIALLANIVIIAVLSLKTPFQHFGFDQPNIALAHFPFNWLPSVVVPIVLFSHLAALRQLTLRWDK